MWEKQELEDVLRVLPHEQLVPLLVDEVWAMEATSRRLLVEKLAVATLHAHPGFVLHEVPDPQLEVDITTWCTRTADEPRGADLLQLDTLLGRVMRQFLASRLQRAATAWERLFWGVDQWDRARDDADEASGHDDLIHRALHQAGLSYVACQYLMHPLEERAAQVLRACLWIEHLCDWVDPPMQLQAVSPVSLVAGWSQFERAWQRCLHARLDALQQQGGLDTRTLLGWYSKSVRRTSDPDAETRLADVANDPVLWDDLVDRLLNLGAWERVPPVVEQALQRQQSPLIGARLADMAMAACCVLGRCEQAVHWCRSALDLEPTLRRLLWLHALLDRRGDDPSLHLLDLLTPGARTLSPRMVGTLRVLLGHWHAAADVLLDAEGLGWSSPRHAGPVVCPLLLLVMKHAAPIEPRTEDSTPGSSLRTTVALDQLVLVLEPEGLEDIDGSLLPSRAFPEAARASLPAGHLPSLVEARVRSHPPDEGEREAIFDALHGHLFQRLQLVIERRGRRVYRQTATLLLALAEVHVLHGRSSEARGLLRRAARAAAADEAFVAELLHAAPAPLRSALR
jgi:hypothetical protein